MDKPIVASEYPPEPVDWLWRELVPRKMITIFGGRPDQAKGLLTSLIAAWVSNQRFPKPEGKGTRAGKVLISAAEDSYTIMTRPRLQAAGANLKNVKLTRFSLPRDLIELSEVLAVGGIDLLVIDPLASHLSNGVNRHNDSIRQVTDPLIEIIEDTGTAVIVTEHVLKHVSKNAFPLAAIGGSGSGIVASARMAFLLGADPGDRSRRILAPVKHNICEKPLACAFEVDVADVDPVGDVPFLHFDAEVEFDASKLLVHGVSGKRGAPSEKRAEAAEWLAKYLYAAHKMGTAPVKAGVVQEDALQFKMSKQTLRRAAKDMHVIFDPPTGKNCRWALPPDLIEQMEQDELADAEDAAPDINVDTPPETLGPEDQASTESDPESSLTDEDIRKFLEGEDDEDKAA